MGALKGRRLLVYLFLCAVWGSTWLAIKVGLRDLPPLRFAGLRMALACLLLVPFAFRRAGKRPTRRQAFLIAWSGFLQIGLTYALVFTATQWIESGLAALLFSSFPIWVGLFAHFKLENEPLTRRAILASVLGLSGVAAIEAPAVARIASSDSRALVLGGGLMLGAAIASAYANVLNKSRFPDIMPSLNVWGQTLVGSAFLLVLSGLLEGEKVARWTPTAVASLLYLALFGTALTFVGSLLADPAGPCLRHRHDPARGHAACRGPRRGDPGGASLDPGARGRSPDPGGGPARVAHGAAGEADGRPRSAGLTGNRRLSRPSP